MPRNVHKRLRRELQYVRHDREVNIECAQALLGFDSLECRELEYRYGGFLRGPSQRIGPRARHRGPSSINWPLIMGATQTGLTIFRPTDGLDEGPIILQKTVPIGPDDTVGTVYFDHLFPMGVAAMLEAADLVIAGRHAETPQEETFATYEGWCRDAEAEINWHAPVETVYNLVRGCIPAPGVWTSVSGRKMRILEARKHLTRRFADVAGKPGEITSIGEIGIHVAVQGGSLEILKVRMDGGEKVSSRQLCATLGLAIGDRFGTAAVALARQVAA